MPSTYSGQRTAATRTSSPPGLDGLERFHEVVQERPFVRAERTVQVFRDEVLTGAVAEAPGERVDVPLGRRGMGERARVLVDAEREDGRLEHRRFELALCQDADERGRQRAVGRENGGVRLDPVGKLDAVVVEENLLDCRVQGDLLELAEARCVHRLDDDETPDRVDLQPTALHDRAELVGVQAVEVADVPVQRTDRDDRARIEPARGEHRRECVEIGVPVSGDDLLGPHDGTILPRSGVRPLDTAESDGQ